jgi:hypothetical protein
MVRGTPRANRLLAIGKQQDYNRLLVQTERPSQELRDRFQNMVGETGASEKDMRSSHGYRSR